MAEVLVKEFKNGNINVRLDGSVADDQELLFEVSQALDWIDTYILFDNLVMFGNDCGGYLITNIRLNKVYYITNYDCAKLRNGSTVKLVGFDPDADQTDAVNNYFND